MAKELLQYNIEYDRREKDTSFVATQIKTHLRERFNVLVSTVEYEIVDGHLVRPNTTEPFINSIKRGRDTIQTLYPNPVDFDRENAEVAGFGEKTDPILSDPKTPIGKKMLSPSLKGEKDSRYQHNFYDIFTLRVREGKRYVEMSRYSSALSAKEYAARLPGFDPENPPSAAEFLANPIPINDIFITSEQIHQMLHKEHDYMTPSDFEQIWQAVQNSVFLKRYLQNRDGRSFNAILNFADEVWESRKRKGKGFRGVDYLDYAPSYSMIRYFEEKEVRQVTTMCPGKSGADTDDKSPWSVSEFDFNYDFDQPGPCKKCGADVKCGPCGICRSCDVQARKEQQSLKIAA